MSVSVEQQDPSCQTEQITVALCIRPILQSETSCQQPVQVSKDNNKVSIYAEDSQNIRTFSFDYVFGANGKCPGQIYPNCIIPLIDGMFSGYNGTVLAYGQTGSGKSYLMGTAREYLEQQRDWQAVIPTAIAEIFERLKSINQQTKIDVRCSFIEIHQEQIKDLLSPQKQSRIVLREPDPRKDAILEGLMEVQIRNSEDILDCLFDGLKQRSVAATRMNNLSSRSHAIFTIKLTQTKPVNLDVGEEGVTEDHSVNEIVEGKIQFVDLAGSERLVKSGVEGVSKVEACSINKGLLAVGNVIEALCTQKRTHIPYRDHILTRVLRTSLGGNSRTVMIACVSPTDVNLNETVNTLKYATRARTIQNTPVANKGGVHFALTELRNENTSLKDQILMLQARVRNNFDLTEEDFSALRAEMEEERQRRLFLEKEIAVLKGQILRERELNRSLENQIEAIKNLAIEGQEAVELPFDHEPSPSPAPIPTPSPQPQSPLTPQPSDTDSSIASYTPSRQLSSPENTNFSDKQQQQQQQLIQFRSRSFHSYNAFSFDVPLVRKRPATYSGNSNFSDSSIVEGQKSCNNSEKGGNFVEGEEEISSVNQQINRSISQTWNRIGGELPEEVLEGEKVITMDQNGRYILLEQQNIDDLLCFLKSNPFTIISDNKMRNQKAMLWQGETNSDSFVQQIVDSCCQTSIYDSVLITHHNQRMSLLAQIDDLNKRLESIDQKSSTKRTVQDHLQNLQKKVQQESEIIQKYNQISIEGREWEEDYLTQSSKGDMWEELSKRDLTSLVHHFLIKAVELGRKLHTARQQLSETQNEAILQGRLYELLKEHLIAKGHQIRILEGRLEKVSLTNQTLDIWAGQRQRAVQQKVWAYSQMAEQQEEMENLRFQVEKLTQEVDYLHQQLDENCSSVTITPDSNSWSGKNTQQNELQNDDYQNLIQEKMDSLMKAAHLQQENYELRQKLQQYEQNNTAP